MRAVIFYYTKTGHTLQAAEDIAEGLREAGVETDLASVADGNAPELADYEIVAIGSPCHAGSMKALSSGVAKPVHAFLDSLPADALAGKTVGVFSVQSGYGAEHTMRSMAGVARRLSAGRVEIGPVVTAGVPLSLWRGPDASPDERAKLRAFGRKLTDAS